MRSIFTLRILKFIIVLGVPISFGFSLLQSSDAFAVIDRTEAINFINGACSDPSGRRMAHAGYGDNTVLNTSNGTFTYDLRILHKRCRDGYVSEYAVTGYLGSCPVNGKYHNGEIPTQDCLKYTDRHAPGVMRECGNFRCIYTDVWTRNGIRMGSALQPSNGDYRLFEPVFPGRSATIPGWADINTRRLGTYTFRLDNLCDYYAGMGQSLCVDAYARINWYNYLLTPEITSFSDGSGLETPTSNLSVTGSISNTDTTNSMPDTEWRITQVVYPRGETIPRKAGGTSGGATAPCAYFTGNIACNDTSSTGSNMYPANQSTSQTGLMNVADYPIGTQICFAISVKNYLYSSTNTAQQPIDDWRHSALRCYVAGKKPKVNVLGGDLYVGRTLQGVPAPVSARVITSSSEMPTGTFTSWGEYAIVPTGPITNMRSGSASVDGRATNVNLLSFANTGVVTATCGGNLGCYEQGTSMPNIASRFRTSGSSPVITSGNLNDEGSGVYRATTAAVTIDESTITEGKSIVINAPDTDVTINGNISYQNGPFNRTSQLPQLVIIARNITINEGVGNVDAWLIAPGTYNGTTNSNGVIRTCNRPTNEINQDVCNTKLTVNGPVIANRLVMLRTAGADGSNPGDPAEVFNFRSDAYLWALGQSESAGRVTTVYTKELPSRY